MGPVEVKTGSLVEPFLRKLFADEKTLKAGMSTREAFGQALVEVGRAIHEVVVVDADLGKSTYAILFGKEFPERFFECGVAEQNMLNIASGLAASGKIPFATTFSVFLTRAFDQIRVGIAQPKLNVKICGSHSGVLTGEDGKSAHGIEDLAMFNSFIGFTVIVPADAVETALAVEAATLHQGPVYIRTSRPATPIIYGPDYRFTLGKANLMRDGEDATIIAMGIMVKAALDAAKALAAKGIRCRVLNMATVKPLDKDAVLKAAEETGAILVAEEHLEHGGLGSMVAAYLSQHCPVPMAFVNIKEEAGYGRSAKPQELLNHFGLTAPNIVAQVEALLKRKARRQ